MAQEITKTSTLSVTNGNLKIPKLGTTQRITQATQEGGNPGYVKIPVAGVSVSLTGLTNVGWCYVKNLSTANFVTLGPYVGGVYYPFLRLEPGEDKVFRLDRAVIPA